MTPDLTKVLALLSAQLDLKALIQEVLDVCLSVTGAHRAYLLLFDTQGNLAIENARDKHTNDLPVSEFQGSRSIIQRVIDRKNLSFCRI